MFGWAFCPGTVTRPHARERERERVTWYVQQPPRKPQKQGGPYGPGSFERSLNLKEEERGRRVRIVWQLHKAGIPGGGSKEEDYGEQRPRPPLYAAYGCYVGRIQIKHVINCIFC